MQTGHKARVLLPSLSQATWVPTAAHTSPQRTRILNLHRATHQDLDAAKWMAVTAAGEPGAKDDTMSDRAAASSTRGQAHSAKREE